MREDARADLPGPMRRRGPRPLALQLGLATLEGGPDAALIAGIAAYRRHPYRRWLPEPPAIWQDGSTRLLDYGSQHPDGPAVLVVPSLINRSHVLDLMPHRSLLRFLAARGQRPLLLDWGWPGPAERALSIAGYIRRLLHAWHAVGAGGAVIGYCMGGLLALAACRLAPAAFSGLALLATPWDFHAADPDGAARLAATLPLLEPLMALTNALPVDMLQMLFATLDSGGVAAKYRAFGRMAQDGEAASRFVALEDWINDGVPVAAPVIRECLADWYGRNLPGRGVWEIGGTSIAPEALRLPAFVAVPAADRIVPPASARPLAERIPGARLLTPPLGHVGMVMGSRAEGAVWQPLLHWLSALPTPTLDAWS